MLRNPYSLLRGGWRKMVGDHSFAALAKRSSNIWLETKYGWQSAYNDVKNISSLLGYLYGESTTRKMINDEERRWSTSRVYTARDNGWTYPFSASEDWENKLGNRYPGGEWNPSFGNHVRYKRTLSKVCRVGCNQDMAIANRWSKTRAVMRALGIDVRGVLETIWELTPMSFVVDWFADPAGLLQLPASLARLNRRDISDIGYSTKNTYDVEIQMFPKYAPYYWGGWGHAYDTSWVVQERVVETGHQRSVTYHRTSGLPPSGSLVTSLLGKGFSAINGVSGLSLIVQRLLK
jgi:hypothetical protein